MSEIYKFTNNRFTCHRGQVEVGYIEFDVDGKIINTYVFPGFRGNGYGKALIDNYLQTIGDKIITTSCPFFRIFYNEYLQSTAMKKGSGN